ncbi:MAG: CHAD domain-containing protein [Gammaproteobacteria bacterium]|jgi:CHAD domain-containing protein
MNTDSDARRDGGTSAAPDEVAAAAPGDMIRAQLERSIARLQDPDLPPAWVVHEVRKDLKRARALLRLCGDALPTRRAEKRCAAAARALAHLRDADAAEETVARLRSRADARELAALDAVSAWIAAQRSGRPGSGGLSRSLAKQVAGELQDISAEVESWSFRGVSAEVLDAGLDASRRESARAFRRAAADGRTKRFHDFRKAVKRELYQRELSGRPLERMERSTLKKLADVLGELQDLEVLRGMLREGGKWRGPARRLTRRTAKELKGRALRLGEGRYRRRPS